MTWRERSVEARARGAFTPEEYLLARNWLTCAVGEQHDKMPDVVVYRRTNKSIIQDFEPVDSILARLGSGMGDGFYSAVLNNDFDAVDRLLDEIEDRALLLKREVNAAPSNVGRAGAVAAARDPQGDSGPRRG